MSELLNNFRLGRMEKDLDDRLLINGSYRDALNVEVATSDGSDVGALQKVLGNTLIAGLPSLPADAKCIGSVRDTKNNNIYWFVTGTGFDFIAEYNGTAIDMVLVDRGTILDFHPDFLITGVNILDEVIYFTDNRNEPRQVDIAYWKPLTNANNTTTSTGLSADKITVIRKSPLNALTYTALPSTIISGAGTISGDQIQIKVNNNTSISLSTYSVGDTITNITFIKQTDSTSINPSYVQGTNIILTNSLSQKATLQISSINTNAGIHVYEATLVEIDAGIATSDLSNQIRKKPSQQQWTPGTDNAVNLNVQVLSNNVDFFEIPVSSAYNIETAVTLSGSPGGTGDVTGLSLLIKYSFDNGNTWNNYYSGSISHAALVSNAGTISGVTKNWTITKNFTNVNKAVGDKMLVRLEKTGTTTGLSFITSIRGDVVFKIKQEVLSTPQSTISINNQDGSYLDAHGMAQIDEGMLVYIADSDDNYSTPPAKVIAVNTSTDVVTLDRNISNLSAGTLVKFNGTYGKISSDITEYDSISEEVLGKFQEKFPTFSYRYKYSNNQYSTFAPFSLPAFVPGTFKYLTKDGFNAGMLNSITSLTLTGWQADISSQFGSSGTFNTDLTNSLIEEVDILYKASNDQNIYVVDTIKKSNSTLDSTFEIKDNQIYKVVDSMQLLRHFDSVPKKALAQEIVGNRLIYANYTENFDYTGVPSFAITTDTRSDTFNQKLSLKSNRTYQFGVVFQDIYGRKTPVFTGTNSTHDISKELSTSNIQFKVTTTASSIDSNLTHFKYFIKETSKEYYNIAISNYYDDNSGFAYLSVPSSDRNKVSENDYIVFKKQNGANNSYSGNQNGNRFKILDISNDAPSILSKDITIDRDAGFVYFGESFSSQNVQINKKAGMTPVSGYNKIQISHLSQTTGGIHADNDAYLKPGVKLRFKTYTGSFYTKAYEISSLRFHGSGSSRKVEILFKNFIDDDVNVFYDDLNRLFSVKIEFITEASSIGNKNFDGKFFLKINTNDDLLSNFNTYRNTGDFVVLASTYSDVDTSDGTEGAYVFTGITSGQRNITITTDAVFDNPESSYDDDTFSNNIISGNFIRISDAAFNNKLLYSNYYEISSVSTSGGGSASKVWVITLSTDLLVSVADDTSSPFRFEILNINKETNSDSSNPAIFEVEPEEGLLDLYYETQETFPISQIGSQQTLSYANVINFGNGVESDRIRDDFNAPTIGKGVRVSTVFEDTYNIETLPNRFIYSQIYNSKSGVNRLNQFIIADTITKDINPSHGSIQLLKTRDTDLIALCEDKCFRVQANKDSLFNADGSSNITASNKVLGQAIPYVGEYGISKNPESFAQYGFRAYFTDRERGVVLRLSRDGLSEISSSGMSDYFSDKLANVTSNVFGSYDDRKNSYNLSFTNQANSDPNETISFNERVGGWTSRKSFIPETGLSLNNQYFTFKNGYLYKHHSNTYPNIFYAKTSAVIASHKVGSDYEFTVDNANASIAVGMYVYGKGITSDVTVSSKLNTNLTFYFNTILSNLELDTVLYFSTSSFFSSSSTSKAESSVKFVFNEGVDQVKRFKNLSYEGDAGWLVDSIKTNEHSGTPSTFVKKEGKYYSSLSGVAASNTTLNAEEFNVQGIGVVSSVVGSVLTFTSGVNNSIQIGDNVYFLNDPNVAAYTSSGTCTAKTATTITVSGTAPAQGKFVLFDKGGVINQAGLLGFFAEVEMKNTTTDKAEIFSVGSLVV